MITSKIRYKGYLWEHNPKTLVITTKQKLHEQIIPNGNAVIQDFGKKSRVVKGTGMLFGENCLEQYDKILKLQNKKGSGILSLPNTKPFYAYFKSIELDCDPTPDMVTYNFEFVEDLSRSVVSGTYRYHTVVEGETLWHIANEYEISIEALVLLNPQIKRIDELKSGEQVRVC